MQEEQLHLIKFKTTPTLWHIAFQRTWHNMLQSQLTSSGKKLSLHVWLPWLCSILTGAGFGFGGPPPPPSQSGSAPYPPTQQYPPPPPSSSYPAPAPYPTAAQKAKGGYSVRTHVIGWLYDLFAQPQHISTSLAVCTHCLYTLSTIPRSLFFDLYFYAMNHRNDWCNFQDSMTSHFSFLFADSPSPHTLFTHTPSVHPLQPRPQQAECGRSRQRSGLYECGKLWGKGSIHT